MNLFDRIQKLYFSFLSKLKFKFFFVFRVYGSSATALKNQAWKVAKRLQRATGTKLGTVGITKGEKRKF